MVQITLSAIETDQLHAYGNTSPIGLIRDKAYAILQRSRKIKIKDIAFVLNVNCRTAERWMRDFKNRRMASIFNGLLGNQHAAKLTREQKKEIQEVLGKPPTKYGLPREFWDVPQLKDYVFARFGTVYESDRSYHFLLEFGNLSFKYPDTFAFKRDEGQIAKRMEKIYQEIMPLLEDPAWEVFVSDEVRMQLEAITRKAWLPKGKKTVIKVKRSDDYQNYLGFLNQRSFKNHVFEIAWGRAPEIVRATGELLKLYPDKKICIIWDNATCHKGPVMEKALAKGGLLERVHLVPLPPYAPDQNPIEHVWEAVKGMLANHQNRDFEETKQKFMRLANNNFFYYQI
jgi:transposase